MRDDINIDKAPRMEATEAISRFCMGNIYPIAVCGIVFVGSITGLELWLNFAVMALGCAALLLCDSIKPFIICFISCYMQISLKNSPYKTDWFLTGYRLPIVIASVVLMLSAVICFAVKNKIYKRINLSSSPMLLAAIIFSAALLLNGVFSDGWSLKGLGFAALNAFVYIFAFLLIYHGFSEEDKPEELLKYISYVSMLVALLISAQMVHLYLTNDSIFQNGSINKVEVTLGWGIWNFLGVSLTVLIPVIFLGMHNNKYPWLYFSVATLAYAMAVLTMSRNALVFASLTYAVCVLVSCFKGKHKRAFRIITAIGIVAAAALAILLWSKIQAVLGDYFERGFSDNGRFLIWSAALESFKDNPIFGGGFYGLSVEGYYPYSFLPLMAHNTVFELLSATGIVGLAAYGFYIYKQLKPAFIKPNTDKFFLALSLVALQLQGLLDNFAFVLLPLFYTAVISAVLFKTSEQRIAPDEIRL